MRRLVWVAVGAVGGVLAYRKAQEALADARERGVVLSAQQVGLSAASAVTTARSLAASAATALDRDPVQPAGSAAARVLRSAQRGEQ
jgi:hypothetical protein